MRLALTLPQLEMLRRYARSRFIHRFRDRAGFEQTHREVPSAACLLDLADVVLATVREVERSREQRRKSKRGGPAKNRGSVTRAGFVNAEMFRFEASADGKSWAEISKPAAEDARS
jgi:hypothetical protein